MRAFVGRLRRKTIRAAREALNESESRFRRAIESAAIPIMIHADDRSVELVNREWTELTGYAAESLQTTVEWARLAYRDQAEKYLAEAELLFSLEGRDRPRLREITTRDGRKIVWIIHSALLDRQRSGKRIIITTAVDITERLAAEREARRQQRLLIQSEKMATLGLLVAGMAHEINSPNHAIRINVELLARMWTSAQPILDVALKGEEDTLLGGLEYRELRHRLPLMLKAMLDASSQIDSIIRGLKGYARTDDGDEIEEVEINLVAKASVELLRTFIVKSTNNFRLELAPSLPLVQANFHGLEQVVVNLIKNACQALEDISQAVVVRSSYDPQSERLWLEVIDEGRGMTAEDLARIRDPFFTTKRREGGIGLGIPISVAIAEKYGGTLEFDTSPGNGTRAILELPSSIVAAPDSP